ncbi:hypothetical protein ykris0001_14030 [Yersinia kristensenii ATCC 33638]|nr:hypothetical protein ykris0001_14030 [Yersinia kristensenii ATCC 33638]
MTGVNESSQHTCSLKYDGYISVINNLPVDIPKSRSAQLVLKWVVLFT